MNDLNTDFPGAIGVDSKFLTYITSSVLYNIIDLKLEPLKSSLVTAAAKGFNQFWEDNESIYKSMSRREVMILEFGTIDVIIETLSYLNQIDDSTRSKFKNFLLDSAIAAKRDYYENR